MGPRGPHQTIERLKKEPKLRLSSKLSLSYFIFPLNVAKVWCTLKKSSETLIQGPQGAPKDLKEVQKQQKIVLIKEMDVLILFFKPYLPRVCCMFRNKMKLLCRGPIGPNKTSIKNQQLNCCVPNLIFLKLNLVKVWSILSSVKKVFHGHLGATDARGAC